MRPTQFLGLLAAFAAGLIAHAQPASAQSTLQQVKARGVLLCGSNPGLAGFALADAQGVVRGLDADTCRAVAAAVLGDATKVRFVPLATPALAIGALRERGVDLVARNLTQTMSRDADLGLSPAGITYYDGQGFLVPLAAGIADMAGLDGKRICVAAGTSNESALADALRRFGIRATVVQVPSFADNRQAYRDGRCDAVTGDISALVALRQTGTDNPAAHGLLPGIISREPLGPLVRDGDAQWRSIVFWVVNLLVEGEARDITSANAESRRRDASPTMRHLMGTTPGIGAPLGLADDWAFTVLRQVGNYAEIYDRNLGRASPLGLDRGLNALWNVGGLLYPIPMR